MQLDLVQYMAGDTAVKIAESVENGVRQGKLRSGQKLPTVRDLAAHLKVSPATVASAYQMLQMRGLLIAQGRRGTRISHRPIARTPAPPVFPPGVRNLYDGNPDPKLLPPMGPWLAKIDPAPRLYGVRPWLDGLVKLVSRDMKDDGLAPSEITFANGALDGMERVLAESLLPGDRVGVEDPCFGNILDLVMSRGLSLVPVELDAEGMKPDSLKRACAEEIKALIVTPRAQNPTGAAISPQRAKELRAILKRYPDVLVIEDDHASLITDVPLECVHLNHPRWAYLRSLSKGLNPDLRLAALTGDPHTMNRVQDRMVVGERWVSHILQQIALVMLSDAGIRKQLRHVARTYTLRREALVQALSRQGFRALGVSGYNVWLPVSEETPIVQAMFNAGWGISAGERFRVQSPPAVRITTATLQPAESVKLAADLTAALVPMRRSATV